MNIIFLDIDGVLNCSETTEEYAPYIPGVDPEKLRLLKDIVTRTQAEIVLTSTWKMTWYKEEKEKQGSAADYLDEKFSALGLSILDKTEDDGVNRGKGILDWLRFHTKRGESCRWVVLDDQEFLDFERWGILPHLIKTGYYEGGLLPEHVEEAVRMLSGA